MCMTGPRSTSWRILKETMGKTKKSLNAKHEPPAGYTCKYCRRFHKFPAYVYAHFNDNLVHECTCGAKHRIVRGMVIDSEPPKKSEKK